MINPIVDKLNQRSGNNISSNQLVQQINNMVSQMTLAANPQKMFEQMVLQNPNVKQVVELIKQNDGNAEKAFYSYAQQLGINPNEIKNNLRRK